MNCIEFSRWRLAAIVMTVAGVLFTAAAPAAPPGSSVTARAARGDRDWPWWRGPFHDGHARDWEPRLAGVAWAIL